LVVKNNEGPSFLEALRYDRRRRLYARPGGIIGAGEREDYRRPKKGIEPLEPGETSFCVEDVYEVRSKTDCLQRFAVSAVEDAGLVSPGGKTVCETLSEDAVSAAEG
jgi:hypothetical protein